MAKKRSFARRHGLGIVSILLVILWIVLYSVSDDHQHWGSFFGNAIADWTGVVVTVIATEYLYELGSSQSRKPPHEALKPVWLFLLDHSLTIFLVITGMVWVGVYSHMDSESKWGQVVGNIVSEWTQILGMVVLTKKLMEVRSKESK